MKFKEKLIGALTLLRPLEWSKSFGNMVFGALIAMAYWSAVDFSLSNVTLFLLGFIAVGPLLWGGLYALNDWTDIERDKEHPVKKNRPLPSGILSANQGLALALASIGLSFAIGLHIWLSFGNFMFLVCLTAMLVNQLLYTIPPIKLKERPVLDLISGSLVNPIFRFYAGWVLFMPAFNAPILFLIFIMGLQFGGYAMYRLSGKKVEKKLAYKSSVTVFGEKGIRIISYITIGIALLSYTLMTLIPDFLPALKWLGYLRIEFLYFGLIMALPAPVYLPILKNPTAEMIKKYYPILYSHFILFIIGFVALFVFFPLK